MSDVIYLEASPFYLIFLLLSDRKTFLTVVQSNDVLLCHWQNNLDDYYNIQAKIFNVHVISGSVINMFLLFYLFLRNANCFLN